MGFVDEPAEGRVAAEHRVDFLVIVRVIAMIGGRLEHRGEVDGVDSQILEIVEVLDHADQVAPLVAVIRRRRAPLVQVPRFGNRHAPREPIGKDLVKDGITNPFWGLGIHHGAPQISLLSRPAPSASTLAGGRRASEGPREKDQV